MSRPISYDTLRSVATKMSREAEELERRADAIGDHGSTLQDTGDADRADALWFQARKLRVAAMLLRAESFSVLISTTVRTGSRMPRR